MKPQKTPKNNLEEEEQSCRYNSPRFQTILHSYSNLKSMVLAQNRHRDQWSNTEPRNKPMHLWSINLQQKYTLEKRQTLQEVVMGKLGSQQCN